MPERTYSVDGGRIFVDEDAGLLRVDHVIASRPYVRESKLPGGEFARVFAEWIDAEAEAVSASTWKDRLASLEKWVSFAGDPSLASITPERFVQFMRWLPKGGGVSPNNRDIPNRLVIFAEFVADLGRLDEDDVESMQYAFSNHFTGYRTRKTIRTREELKNSLTSKEFGRLFRSVRILMDDVRAFLDRGEVPEGGLTPAAGLVHFPMLLGLQLAVRSAEINNLNLGDIQPGLSLHVHAPNKSPHTWVFDESCPALLASWQLAKRWQERCRVKWEKDSPALLVEVSDQGRADSRAGLVRFDSMLIRAELRRLYARFFERREANGDPILFRRDEETGVSIPFDLPISRYRSAAITQYTRQEVDPVLVQKFARHRSYQTTETYYILKNWTEWQEEIFDALSRRAEEIAMVIEGRVATSEELSNGMPKDQVPAGLCGSALEGKSCQMKGLDCRLCPYLRIDPSREENLILQFEEEVETAREYEENGWVREAQNRKNMAALTQAIVMKIREWRAVHA